MVRLFSASQSVILVLRRMAPLRRMARRLDGDNTYITFGFWAWHLDTATAFLKYPASPSQLTDRSSSSSKRSGQ